MNYSYQYQNPKDSETSMPSANLGHGVQVDGLTKKYRRRVVVDHVSFGAPAGKVTTLIGDNGSGKSTTLRMIVGLVRPTEGTATIGARTYSTYDNPTREVGVVLDNANFPASVSVERQLRHIAIASDAPLSRVRELSTELGLKPYLDHKFHNLSTGMRRRFELACALVGDPSVLILDEASTGLDAAGLDWFYGIISSLRDNGKTILMVSHRYDEVEAFADRIVVLSNGAVTKIQDLT